MAAAVQFNETFASKYVAAPIAAPAAGLLALVAPSGGEPNQCAPLLEQMKAGKAPVTVKPTK